MAQGRSRLLVVLAITAITLAGCGNTSDPADGSEDAAGGSGGTVLADTITGFVTQAGQDGITLDEITILSGEEAAAAREEDGVPPVEEGIDVPYLRNTTREAYEIPVARDVQVQVFDCTAECQLVDWDYADLVSGTPLPYGSVQSPFTVVVEEGEVVEIVEIYLP